MTLFTLDLSGTVLAVIFGILVLYFGLSLWWFFISVLVEFLVVSALATQAGFEKKSAIRGYEKTRGWRNVMANGLVPVLIVFLYYVSNVYGHAFASVVLIYAFVAGVAGITADKFASEFGVLDGEPKVLINGKKAKRGTSGAVTWFGTIMGGIAATIIGITIFSLTLNPIYLIIIVAAGLFGNVVDSVFGYFEEKGIGNKYTSNLLCSLASAGLCAVLIFFIS